MTMRGTDRPYPDEIAGPFPEPPLAFTDKEGREIEILAYDRRYEGIEDEEDEEFEALVAMYDDFDPAQRAQGIPPSGEERIRDWLEALRDELNVMAWHDDIVAGHATLVSDVREGDEPANQPEPQDESGDGTNAYELAIFVHQDYQGAGIGMQLIQALLGHGKRSDVEKVWLTVERWNRAAVSLYEQVGFETSDSQSFELEMSLRI